MIAGREAKNVTNMMIAFATAPVNGHIASKRFLAMVDTVGVLVFSASVINEKPIRSPPVPRKSKSVRMKVRRILSFMIASSNSYELICQHRRVLEGRLVKLSRVIDLLKMTTGAFVREIEIGLRSANEKSEIPKCPKKKRQASAWRRRKREELNAQETS